MKKVIAILAIATTLVSCGGGVSNNPTTDSTTIKTDSVTVDSTSVKTDSTVNTK
jgi:ABC-type glycerol-3-phosphate transport system substrate-binding protein